MTNTDDSKPNAKVVDFKPKNHLAAEAQLNAFIEWAKETVPKGMPNRVYESIRWEDDSWHQHGFERCAFTSLGSNKTAPIKMQPPITDFVKAVLVHARVYQARNEVCTWLRSMRALEGALVELTGTRDVTRVSAAVCNRACEHMNTYWPGSSTAYSSSKALEKVIALMQDKKLLKTNFRWTSPLKQKSRGTLEQQKADRRKKLPSSEAIKALGEMFNNDLTSPLDIIVTSACALLLSVPSRVGELASLEPDCVVLKEGDDGNRRMFLRWYAEKINRPVLKPVAKPEMERVVDRALALLKPITNEARAYAAWLEDHPDEFPPHARLPRKGHDDPLTYEEACAALKMPPQKKGCARTTFKFRFLRPLEKRKGLGLAAKAILDEIREEWDTSQGKRIYVEGKQGIQGYEFHERGLITLRKLNVLMREKYLPKHFPYTTPYAEGRARIKFRDALFTVRTGALSDETKDSRVLRKGLGVEIAATPRRMALQLAGSSSSASTSIFERHGYLDLKVNTHSFRHELNTQMQRAGLSQFLIDAFSGRTSMGSVYNHETAEERMQRVADHHPKTKDSNSIQRLEMIKTNQPLSLSDVRDLHESDKDRVIHQTHVGICVHNFAAEPCPKMGACLTCVKLGCVKGDEVKLANLKEERKDLKRRYDKALDAQARDIFGASEWAKKVAMDLYKCNALIQTLESPELDIGDIVWNVDNGWTLTNNAAVMAGLLDGRVTESATRARELLSLDEVSAMLEKIED